MLKSKTGVFMPKLGESIVSATVLKWFKSVGDYVQKDEALLEVTTDKVNSEIPSPVSGKIVQIFAELDKEYDVGTILCELQTDEERAEAIEQKSKEEQAAPLQSFKDFYSPAVLHMAKQHAISIDRLKDIKRTGKGDRLTKKDLEKYLNSKPLQMQPLIEKIKMTNVRKAIADNMVKSFTQAPHASLVQEVDVTRLLLYVKDHKQVFLQKHGIKLTLSTFFAKAISTCIKDYPYLNASVENDTIILKKQVNLGIAVNVDQAVVVPVLKNCEALDTTQIAKQLDGLITKARSNALLPDDVKDGSITLTNFGMANAIIGIPIIRYPEVAIIGIGAIKKRVCPMQDHSIAIRDQVHISTTFDHRALDGIYACEFLEKLKQLLENPEENFSL